MRFPLLPKWTNVAHGGGAGVEGIKSLSHPCNADESVLASQGLQRPDNYTVDTCPKHTAGVQGVDSE